MSAQWGHGFHTGTKEGEKWGELFANGKWEAHLSDVSARLMLLANALRLPVEFKSGRTELWWQLYVSAAAKQIEAISAELPGTINSAIEFEKDAKSNQGGAA